MFKILAYFTLFSACISFGQDVSFKTFTTDDGLSNNSVNDIENDVNGGLWIGTWDGLNYFNGNEFKVFKHIKGDTTSIAGNEVYKILKDKHNTIWTLTDEGLSKYTNNNQFKNYSFNEAINNISLSKNLTLVIALQNGKKLTYKNNRFVNFLKSNNAENQKNLVYKKILWSKYANLIINDVFIDNDKILFATQSNGLFLLKIVDNDYQITNYKHDIYNSSSFKSNEIEEIHKDIFGGIWLAFKDGGISLLQESIKGVSTIVPHPKDFPHLPTETVRAITKDNDNNLWLGYYSNGLQKFNKKTNCFIPFNIAKKNPDWSRVRSLFTDSKGAIWAGTYAGIIRILNNNATYFSAKENPLFFNNRNYSFFEDETHNLWIACWGGIAKLNLNELQFTSFLNQKLLNNVHIRDVYKHKSTLIIASENKSLLLFNIKKGTFKKISEKNGLAGNSVFSILHQKKTNKFWISCLGGISIINEEGEVLKTITEKNGLPSHMVYGLLEQDGKIWASTTKGIGKIDINTYQVEKISNSKQWQATEFSEGAYYKDANGTLYFGGVKGISYFNPKDLKVSEYLPKLNVIINGKTNPNKVIKKSYNENYLKIKVVPIAFEKNANNKVHYKLEGFDNQWQELNDDFIIFYKSLPAKKYKLLIKNSLNNQGNPLTYSIIITPPFYFTNWFLTLVLFVFVLALLIYLFNKNRIRKNYQKKLEEEIKNRTKVVNRQKEELLKLHNSVRNNEFEVDNFKKFIVDKFKQPLALVIENLSKINPNTEEKELVKSEVKKLMNRVMQWDYLEDVSSLSEFKKSIAKASFIEKQLLLYKKQFTSNHIEYTINFKTSVDFIELDIVRCKLMFQYLINVLLNYRQPKTFLHFNITVSKNNIELIFTSNNHIIIDSVAYIKQYNRYFIASQKIVNSLKGSIEKEITTSSITLVIKIPITIPTKENIEQSLQKTTLSLNELPKNKKIILVYTNKNDFNAAKCLIESKEYYLLFEDNLKNIFKYISKTELFHLLIFYNVSFSSKVIELLSFIVKNKNLPTLYISEKIDYLFLEKIETYQINDLIQLPTSNTFITKKINYLLTHNNNIIKKSKQKSSPNQIFVNQATTIVKNNFSNPSFNVEYLINELKISRVKCYRMFKEVLHQAPSDYINQYRMKKAVEILKEKKLSISEIAYECGYNDPKYFSKSFKKFYGTTPKKYSETYF